MNKNNEVNLDGVSWKAKEIEKDLRSILKLSISMSYNPTTNAYIFVIEKFSMMVKWGRMNNEPSDKLRNEILNLYHSQLKGGTTKNGKNPRSS